MRRGRRIAGIVGVTLGMLSSASWARAENQVRHIPVVANSDRTIVANGDCSGNGQLDKLDQVMLSLYISGEVTPSHTEFLRCDANQNGHLDRKDGPYFILVGTTTIFPAPVPMSRFKPGDANGDGVVTTTDAALIEVYLNNSSTAVMGIKVYNADCNSDGVINTKDVKGALNIAVGLQCN